MRIAFALTVYLSTTIVADAASLWDHNGSVVSLEANGSIRKFYYQSPRPNLPVTSGTLLFSGRKEGERYSGTAYIFSARCGARAYPVSGPVAGDQRSVTLYGKAPRVDSNCRVIGFRDDVLVFTFQDTDRPSTVAMTIGRDAIAFHFDYNGRTVLTKEPFEDRWWRYMDVLNAVYRPVHKATGRKFFFPEIREVENLSNALAVIRQGQRYVLIDPDIWADGSSYVPEMIIYGHEVGHHVCGHTVGELRGLPWEKELEADRFAGAALRALYEDTEIADYRAIYERFTLEVVTQGAWQVFARMTPSSTHPPSHMRVAAVINGYNNSSACIEKGLLDAPATGAGAR